MVQGLRQRALPRARLQWAVRRSGSARLARRRVGGDVRIGAHRFRLCPAPPSPQERALDARGERLHGTGGHAARGLHRGLRQAQRPLLWPHPRLLAGAIAGPQAPVDQRGHRRRRHRLLGRMAAVRLRRVRDYHRRLGLCDRRRGGGPRAAIHGQAREPRGQCGRPRQRGHRQPRHHPGGRPRAAAHRRGSRGPDPPAGVRGAGRHPLRRGQRRGPAWRHPMAGRWGHQWVLRAPCRRVGAAPQRLLRRGHAGRGIAGHRSGAGLAGEQRTLVARALPGPGPQLERLDGAGALLHLRVAARRQPAGQPRRGRRPRGVDRDRGHRRIAHRRRVQRDQPPRWRPLFRRGRALHRERCGPHAPGRGRVGRGRFHRCRRRSRPGHRLDERLERVGHSRDAPAVSG